MCAALLAMAAGCGESSAGDEPADAGQPAGVPDTDIYLASLEGGGGSWTVGEMINASARSGYDNQPAFTPDGQAILYTAADGAGRTDIMRYDIAAGSSELVTQTYPESEYSATPLPTGDGFSVIRVEADSTQRLWRFDWDGSSPGLVLPDVAPAGYHAWHGDSTVVLFVLGSPPTLQVVHLGGAPARVVDSGIGRSLQPVPSGGVSYVSVTDTAAWIRILDPESGASRPFAPAVEDSQNRDHAWTPDGHLLMTGGSTLFVWRPSTESWEAIMSHPGLTLTRLTVSPDGRSLAIVGLATDS